MKKPLAATLAALVVLLAPGLGSYAAAAEIVRSLPTAPLGVSLPGASASMPALPALLATQGGLAAPVAGLPAAPANAYNVVSNPAVAAQAPADRAVSRPSATAAQATPTALGQVQAAAPVSAAAPAAAGDVFDGAALKGKSLLLVGTSAARPFILSEAKRVADQLGLTLYLLDKPSARAASVGLVPEERFIPAPIDDHSEAAASAVVRQVASLAAEKGLAAVVSFLNPYAQLAGDIADEIGARGPSGKAVRIAHTKSLAREALAGAPDIATPYRVVKTAEEARAFFREQGEGARVVMKPIKGGGSQGVITDIAGEDEAAAAFARLDAELDAFTKRADAGFFNLDQHPGIMMERQLEGPEVDVELIVRNGEVEFSHVSDNAPMDRPLAIEKNSTYASVLSEADQKGLVEAAARSAALMGLTDGNLHVEMMLTKDGPRLLEVNARMGGAFVWEFVRDQTGVSLVEQGLRAVLGLPVDAGRKADTTLEARFLIPAATGRIEAIEGLDALEKTPGFVRLKMLHKEGDQVKAAPDDAFDYIGYVGVRGKDWDEAVDRTLAALSAVRIRIRKADGTVVEQTGAHSHAKVDPRSLLAPKKEEEKPGALATILSLPRSFLLGFTPGWTVNAIGMEIQAVALPLFTASLFDLPTALLMTGLGFVLRAAGAWLGSSLMSRINPVKVNNAALLAVVVAGAALAAAGLLGAGSGVILGLLIGNAVIGGLAYGVTRGVAENLIPRLILGKKDEGKLETALNFAYQWVELGCIAAALFVAVPLLNLVGGPWMMGISSALIGAARLFYASVRFAEEPKVQAQAGAATSEEKGDLKLADYAPVAFFRLMHFLMYGVLATVLALSVFHSDKAAGTTIGVYDAGSWLFSLLASLSLLPKKLGRRSSVVLGGLAAAAFLWSAVAAPFLPVTAALGGLLGGMITLITNKWMPFYSKHLPEDRYRNLSKWLMTASIGGLLPVFAAVSAIRLSPAVAAVFSMQALLVAIAAGVTAAAVGLAYLMWRDRRPD